MEARWPAMTTSRSIHKQSTSSPARPSWHTSAACIHHVTYFTSFMATNLRVQAKTSSHLVRRGLCLLLCGFLLPFLQYSQFFSFSMVQRGDNRTSNNHPVPLPLLSYHNLLTYRPMHHHVACAPLTTNTPRRPCTACTMESQRGLCFSRCILM